MRTLKIINKDNQKGVCLDTYGNGFFIPQTPLRLVLIGLCLCSPGTNWLIPKILTLKSRWFRYDISKLITEVKLLWENQLKKLKKLLKK